MTTASKAGTELSTETNAVNQDEVKINLPSLPDAFSEESLLRMFESVDKEVKAEVPDVETEDGRKRIKSLAAKISKSKTALDTPMRDYLRILKTQPKELEKNARESKERFDKLRDELLAPLAEAQAWQDGKLSWLDGIPSWCASNPASADLSALLVDVNEFVLDDIWPELLKKFKVAHEAAVTTLTVTLERITMAEAQALELEELRRKQAAAEQAERDRKIADEAAANARAESEAKAQRDREAVDRRAAESRQREEDSKAAEQKAIRDAELAEQRRIDDAAAAAEQRKQDAIAAEERQAEAVKLAAENEAKRIAEQEAEHEKEAKAREAKKDHRASIHRAALVAMIGLGIDEIAARAAIMAIRDKKIPNIHITY